MNEKKKGSKNRPQCLGKKKNKSRTEILHNLRGISQEHPRFRERILRKKREKKTRFKRERRGRFVLLWEGDERAGGKS